jgi:predicted transcriptional regulator
MRKSKLGLYEDILDVLVNKPLTIDQAAYELDMDCTILRKCLDFLIRNGLVEERGSSKTTLYAITEKGIRVLKALNFPKYLEKITNKMTVIDETLQILRELENRNRKKRSSSMTE